jgi:2-keto-4-pentenoate hydratase/2-oxohepta-3-ene-1,7-dioic acid hydratase in catechol pathway
MGCDFDRESASELEGDIYTDFSNTGKRKHVKKILTPISPCVIFCIGLNYKLHAKENGLELPRYPVVFMKNLSAVVAHLDDIKIPASCAKIPEVEYEAELAVVIKKNAKNVLVENALDYVLGYACANDISARRWQKHAGGNQFGPWIVTPDEICDPDNLGIECILIR